MVFLQNLVLKIIFVLTKFKICQHKFDPKSDSIWWDSEVFLHTFLLIVWFISTKLMILLHGLGPEFDAYWWRTEFSLNFFVLKAYFFLAKFIIFNSVLTSNLIHMMDFFGCITYFCAENPIYFDQFYDFWTSLWPKVWFILIEFYGFVAYFRSQKIDLFWPISFQIQDFSTKVRPKFWFILMTFCGFLANFCAQNWTYFNHIKDFVIFFRPKIWFILMTFWLLL